jgi:nucleotide-binding universal stress UspA family protein
MYKNILLALDATASDQRLLCSIAELARSLGARLTLLHVADGFAAQHQDSLNLVESEEMKQDKAYLEAEAQKLRASGVTVETLLAHGEPPAEILAAAQKLGCDLIALTSHGHRFIADVVLGSTISNVRHRTRVPLLIIPPA